MAKIIYKEGLEGQNRLECIEGIEIDLLNGQCALIYPKYARLPLLGAAQIDEWKAKPLAEIEALKEEENTIDTDELLRIGSPAAKFVRQFKSGVYGQFNIPTLLAALEITHQLEEINELAETIEGADLLEEGVDVSSCSRCSRGSWWIASGGSGFAAYYGLSGSYVFVPTIVYDSII